MASNSSDEITHVSPSELGPSDVHVRSEHEEPSRQLLQSVSNIGVLFPPIGRHEDGELRLIDGVRRAMAAEAVGIDEIPVVVRDLDDTDARIQSMTLNSDTGTANNKNVYDEERENSLDRLAELRQEDRETVEADIGLLSEADLIERELEGAVGLGRATAEKIADHHTHEELKEQANNDGPVITKPISLTDIDGIGDKVASAVWDQFSDGDQR